VPFPLKAQTYAAKVLEERGVQLRLDTRVKEVGSGHVMLSDGTRNLDAHRHLGRRAQGCVFSKQLGDQHWAWRPH
jgi:NADH dehydrogenase FAD-containing subunit